MERRRHGVPAAALVVVAVLLGGWWLVAREGEELIGGEGTSLRFEDGALRIEIGAAGAEITWSSRELFEQGPEPDADGVVTVDPADVPSGARLVIREGADDGETSLVEMREDLAVRTWADRVELAWPADGEESWSVGVGGTSNEWRTSVPATVLYDRGDGEITVAAGDDRRTVTIASEPVMTLPEPAAATSHWARALGADVPPQALGSPYVRSLMQVCEQLEYERGTGLFTEPVTPAVVEEDRREAVELFQQAPPDHLRALGVSQCEGWPVLILGVKWHDVEFPAAMSGGTPVIRYLQLPIVAFDEEEP